MAKIEYVSLEEMMPVKTLRKESQRIQVRSEYEGYIAGLEGGHAGKLTIDKGDKFSTLRDRLRSAARRLDKRIQIRRKGDVIYFRLRDEAIDVPEKPAPRRRKVLRDEAIDVAEKPAPRRRKVDDGAPRLVVAGSDDSSKSDVAASN